MCLISLGIDSVFANPQGGEIVAGDVNISVDANLTSVQQNTPNAIVSWDSFNILPHEAVNFIQPEKGVILNRINASNGASEILGNITANGNVLLINQAGIIFGKDSQVNVGGLIASTLDISNQDFMQNKYIFSGDANLTGKISNYGHIVAKDKGLLALIGPVVGNHGIIKAKFGKVLLVSGEKITLDFNGDDLINFCLTESQTKKIHGDAITNEGLISASGGEILIKADIATEVLDNSINMHGVIEADTLENVNGKILLLGSKGTAKITGNIHANSLDSDVVAGNISIFSDTVILNDEANIDVNGRVGGGEVLVGGHKYGEKSDIPNANRVFIGDKVHISANGLENGDGGDVVVWADHTNIFNGNVSAKGGELSGNGGFVEISGKKNLIFNPNSPIYALAPHGKNGTLLLDPQFLNVQTTGGSSYSAGVNNLYANNAGGTNIITPASIVTAAVGANITLQANTDVTFTNALAITTSGRTLTVNAGRSVLINANVSTTNGAITITANDTGATSADRQTGSGSITMTGSTVSSGTAALSMSIGTSSVSPFSPGNITALGLTASTVSLTTPNALTATTIAATGAITIDVGADSSITGIISGTGAAVTKNGTGLLILSGANTYTGATLINAGTLRASNATALGTVASSATIVSGATLDINAVAIGAKPITVSGSGVSSNGAITGTGTCSLSGAITLAADTTIGGTGTFTQTGIISGAFAITKVGTGTVSLSGANTFSGNLNINQGTLRAGNATGLGSTAATAIVASGATLDINAVTVGAKPLQISGTGVSSVGALTGTGTSTYGGAVSLLADSTIGGTGTFTMSGIVSGAFNLTKTGTGSISLSNANTYSGTTNITQGTLRASNATALGSVASAATVSSGATLDINGVSVGAKPLTISGTGASSVGALIGTGTSSYSGSIALAADSTIGGTGNTTTLSGVISGAFNLSKIGTGTFILSNTNTYSGSTTISAGTIRVSTDANLGAVPSSVTPASIVLAGGTLQATAAFTLNSNRGITLNANSTIQSDVSSLTYNGIITGTGGLTKTGSGTLALGGINTYSGSTTISTATLSLAIANAISNTSSVSLANTSGVTLLLNNNNQTIGSLSGGGTTGGTITLGSATLTINQTASGTYAGTITGTGNLTLSSSSTNTLALTNTSNSYSGITTINAGAISASSDTNLGAVPGSPVVGKIVLNGGSLIGSSSFTLSANRGILLNSSGGTINVSTGATLTYNGTITGTGSLTLAGGGTLSSSAVQAYTGATNINDGVLSLGIADALVNSSSIVLANQSDAGIAFNSFNQTLINLSGGGSLGGYLSLGSGNLTVTQTSDGSYSGVISGTGSLILSSSSTATLTLGNPNNTYTGNTTINAGILSISSDGNLGTAPSSVTAASITLNSGTLSVTENITLNSNRGITLSSSGGSISVLNNKTLIYNGIIAGSSNGAINKIGNGTLQLSGSNTYNGATNINNGVLNAASNSVLGSSTSISITSGAQLKLSFNNSSLANSNTITLNGTGFSSDGAINFAGSNITLNNPLSIASSATITGTGGGDMTFAGAISGSSPLSITFDAADLVLGSVSLTSANLSLTANNISQNNGIVMNGGIASFGINAANGDILLNQNNNFGSNAISFTGTLSNIRDLYLKDIGTSPVLPSVTSLTNLRNYTLSFNNSSISLPATTLYNSGALSVTSGGSITQTGILTIPGSATFNSGAYPITLTENNLITGAVSLQNTGTNNASFTNATNTILTTSSIGGNLSVTSSGSVNQTGGFTVQGTAQFVTGDNEIFLSSAFNQFSSAVSTTNTGNYNTIIRNSSPLILGTINAGQELILVSGGSLTQSGVITANNGATSISCTAANSDITLNSANDFGGYTLAFSGTRSNIRDINITNTSSDAVVSNFNGLTNLRNLTLTFNNAGMIMPTTTLTNSGALSLTANGSIIQTGIITVPGASTISSNANPITLTLANQFSGTLNLNNSGSNDISITNGTNLILAATSIGRNLTCTASGNITQVGNLVVPGESSFSATNGVITLSQNNQFTGKISLSNTGTNDVIVNNTLATILGTITLGQNLNLSSGGNITQAEALTMTNGILTMSVTSPTSSILLPESNDFGTNAPVISGTGANIVNFNLKNINSNASTPVLSNLTNLHFLDMDYPNATISLSSLDMNGTSIFSGYNVIGTLDVHGLQLDTQYCNLYGFVNGLSGQAAIDQIVLLNTITENTHFFDGIDMYGSTPPVPPTPTPETPTLPESTKIIVADNLYSANNYWENIDTNNLETYIYDEYMEIYNEKILSKGNCSLYDDNITVCY